MWFIMKVSSQLHQTIINLRRSNMGSSPFPPRSLYQILGQANLQR